MSGWIKYEKDLETDPRFLRMLQRLSLQRDGSVTAALPHATAFTLLCGALVRFWSYADTHLRADDRLDLGTVEIDGLVGVPGFCMAMPEDWLIVVDDETVELPGYQRHNGVAARKRDLAAKRQETKRRRDCNTERDNGVTGALPDQTRPDQTKTPLRSSSSGDSSPSPSGGFQGGGRLKNRPEENIRKLRAEVADVAKKLA